ncbi:hypothetical protein MOQ_001909 [Trypanosoma cruzi marinkellei]|uniref:Pseudouridine synthase RsuA/RluA-like domain-containing protein n=1 Tax=Trypanosoma cruzi marinkellei TaxID=85056 RepID=K2NF35_TRYCR|nr:hypothetical protein MOQ_001909 [Trypanosoma cruzi marinkellei]
MRSSLIIYCMRFIIVVFLPFFVEFLICKFFLFFTYYYYYYFSPCCIYRCIALSFFTAAASLPPFSFLSNFGNNKKEGLSGFSSLSLSLSLSLSVSLCVSLMAWSDASFGVIYRNEELVVVNKPHDVPMDGEGYPVTVEKWACAYLAKGGCADNNAGGGVEKEDDTARTAGRHKEEKKTVKFVHQLDYATSGVLCVAFSREMAARLAHCFQMRTTRKAYLAVLLGMMPPISAVQRNLNTDTSVDFLHGSPYASHVRRISMDDVPGVCFIRKCVIEASGHDERENADYCATLLEVNLPVGYDTTDHEGFRMTVNGRDARGSVTYVSVLQRGYMTHPTSGCPVPVTKVVLFPRTGRRHQLRVHCHAIGFPILGDVTYAGIPTPRAAPQVTGAEAVATVGAAESINAPDEIGAIEAWQRMMLHAWRLSFPVSVEPLRCGKERYMQKKKRRRETLGLAVAGGDDISDWTHFGTEDPFQLIRRE